MKKVSMSSASFKKEHKHLVKVLKSGNKKKLLKEAKKQGAELKKHKRNAGKSNKTLSKKR